MPANRPIDRRHVLIRLTAAAAGLALPARALGAAPGRRWLDYAARLKRLSARARRTDRMLEIEHGLLTETNAYRAANGLEPLRTNATLTAIARGHAEDMAERNFFDHVTPDGFTSSERVGLLARDIAGLAGENITFGQYLPANTGAPAWFKYWRDSPEHRANLLRPQYSLAGHAMTSMGDRSYAVALYVWPAVRLAKPLPLEIADGDTLIEALASAAPPIGRFQISGPNDDERSRPYRTEAPPPVLQPGAWRLRPFLTFDGASYPVVQGPIFVVG